MKRWTLALIPLVLVSSAAAAETPPRLEGLEVALWPEYDRPAVLVMLQGKLAADAALPATVRLPMPVEAGRPHAVAKRDTGGALLVAQHTVSVEGTWAKVNVMTDQREVRLEYYVDLATGNPERRYVFDWPGGIDIDQVTFEVMQPIGAEDLSVKPAGRQSVGNDGITYVLGDLGSKARTDAFSLEVTYTKKTPTLTAVALQRLAPAGEVPGGTPATPPAGPSGSGGATTWLVVMVIGFAVALAGVWVFIAGRKPQRKQ